MNSNIEQEIWLPVNGYEGSYEVSDLGKVRSLDRLDSIGRKVKGRTMKLCVSDSGYHRVQLFKDGNYQTCLVSRLVAQSFIPNPESKPCVNHIDGHPLNNNVSNLEWVTYAENTQHAVRTGLLPPNIGVKNGQSKLTPDLIEQAKKLREMGYGYRKVAKLVGVSKTGITNALTGKSWKYLNKA
jgi:hypothetical protein